MKEKNLTLTEVLLREREAAKKKEEAKTNLQVQNATLGSNQKGILGFVRNHKKISIGTGILVSIATSVGVASLSGCSNQQNKNFEETTTAIEETMETTPEITTTIETTTTTKATTTTPAEITTEATTTTEAETTTVTVSVTEETAEIIVTPAETTAPVEITTTTAQTTTAPVTTTEAPQPVVEPAKPIQVEDLNGKVEEFKGYLTKAGIVANDEMIKNAIRVMHSDFIEHDGLNEVTAVRYEQQLSLLSSYGSVDYVTLGALYMGYIDKVEEGFYIPAEICAKDNQKIITAFTKLAESYRLGLNSIGAMGVVELTRTEEEQIGNEVMQELDKLNIADDDEWSKKYGELYTAKWQEIYEAKQNEMTEQRNVKVQAEYTEFFNGVMALVNSKEYEALTPSEKMVVFTNISGALVSGMTEDQKNAYMTFHSGIEESIDEARAQLVIANRNNINQKDALDTIIANNIEVKVPQERKDLAGIAAKLENMYANGTAVLIR